MQGALWRIALHRVGFEKKSDSVSIGLSIFQKAEMTLRQDLPTIPKGILNAAAQHGQHDNPRAVVEALETVGSQLREHRAGIDSKMMELQARLQSTQQVLAKMEIEGGFPRATHSALPVSAQVLAESEAELESLRNGKKKSVRMSLPSLHQSPSAAAITSSSMHAPAERDAEVYGPIGRLNSVRDLLITRPTSAPSIEYLRGSRVGTAAIQAQEGDQKAELELNFSLHTAPVKTIACWVPASRQALDDSTMLGDYIDNELRDALRMTEDMQLLKGDGTGSNVLGLMTVAGAYSRAQPGDTPSDTLRRAITQVQLARGNATGIVINPEGLERLELEKDNQGRHLFAYSVTDSNGGTTVWRVPTVVTDAMGPDEFMVGDFVRAARLYDRQQATVEVATEHADFFTRNMIAILAEERVALTVPRPDLLIIGSFTQANP